jgi:hypothetical protein
MSALLNAATFPSQLAALRALDCWSAEVERWNGRKRGELCAYVSAANPAAVIAKLATRSFWLGISTSPALVAELKRDDAEDELRVFIFRTDGGSSVLLSTALEQAEEQA